MLESPELYKSTRRAGLCIEFLMRCFCLNHILVSLYARRNPTDS